ncbi:MAG TPA: hypothetical protein ENI07_15575 [Desulfobacterales bacterium]|nr:hypothetical protein [Desulfobacterales bacterium]
MTKKNETKEIAKAEPTYSQRFTAMVVKEFGAQVGVMALTPLQQKLAQHMFIGIDTQLKALEAKRDDNKPAIVWSNINMGKLAIDAMHRVELGLDALIPNHISPIPYLNGKTKKYDLDLRIGYVGKDCYRRKMAVDEPVDIIYELIYGSDEFSPIKKSALSEVESYEFKITNPFDRGKVVGGFGYIIYENPTKNKLVLVSKADFDKSKGKAQTDKFWKPYEREMQFKTLVLRTTSQIAIDPAKVNASMATVEMDEAVMASALQIEEKANKTPIDIKPETTESTKAPGDPKETEDSNFEPPTPEEVAEAEKEEITDGDDDHKWMDEDNK